MRKWLVVALLGVGWLSGCGSTAAPTSTEPPPTEVSAILPTLTSEPAPSAVPATPSAPSGAETASLGWDTDPETIVLQYDERGGFRVAPTGTHVPLWTLYGDGTVLWSQESEKPSAGFDRELFLGQISEGEMTTLLDVVAQSDILGLDDVRDESIADAPTASLLIHLTGDPEQVSVYPAGSTETPAAFSRVRDHLLSIRPDNSERYDADSFLLRAQSIIPLGELTEDQVLDIEWWPFEEFPLDKLATEAQGARVEGEQAAAIAQFVVENGNSAMHDITLYGISLFGDPPRPVE